MDRERIKAIISDFLERLGVSYEAIEVSEHYEAPCFTVRTGESGRLIGSRGETLAALRLLVKRAAERAHGDEALSFSLDVNDYEKRRVEEMRREVLKQAERARLFKREVELAPMSSYDRFLVHSFFADDPELTTHSAGEGRFRHVVVSYTPKQTGEEGALSSGDLSEER